ncbi:3-deoxy-7-phosphoheptulonate synthase [Pendulispora brunnea]|uniref:Phospho-2-dehydro-3-deoxyheptonate aldolase n=1 Tax=Pendulispora brunnea TaxID=2905690 RepID=A0ABZ2KCY6_9BACT
MDSHESLEHDRWLPGGWRHGGRATVAATLSRLPGLVDAVEVHRLKSELAAAGDGRMFVLQLANSEEERFEDSSSGLVFEHTKNLESVGKYLALMLGKPVLPVGLVAGNYYAGPDANRVLQAYEAALLALESVRRSRTKSYTSHEGANLHFEEALVRRSSSAEGFFASSAHLLGLETTNLAASSSDVEFLRGVLNPIDVRIGPWLTSKELLSLCERLNPKKEPGKIVLATRMGKELTALRRFIRALREAGAPVVWMCDPGWGSTPAEQAGTGARIRDIIAEAERTARLHDDEGSRLSGLCLEIHREPFIGRSGRSPRNSRLSFLQALRVCSDFARAYGGLE